MKFYVVEFVRRMKASGSAITTASSDTAADTVVPVSVIVIVFVISVLTIVAVTVAVGVRVFTSRKRSERLTPTCCTQAPGI